MSGAFGKNQGAAPSAPMLTSPFENFLILAFRDLPARETDTDKLLALVCRLEEMAGGSPGSPQEAHRQGRHFIESEATKD